MATFGGPNNFGLFNNGDFRQGNNTNFTFGTFNNTVQYSGDGCIEIIGGAGSSAFSTEFLEVDTSKNYQMIAYARTLQRGSQNNSLGGGFLGFACYDDEKTFISVERNGGYGNTTLSRNANIGDSEIYINSNNGWYQTINNLWYFRYILFYPASHPKYSTPYEYTKVGPTNLVLYSPNIQQMPEGDYKLQLVNTSGNPTTLPNLGYSLPAGTPVSNGRAGGTYNYVLNNNNFPETWTRYSSGFITGEGNTNISGSSVFRYGTKYVRFLVLMNYNARSETPQDHKWALDNIFFGKSVEGKDYRNIL